MYKRCIQNIIIIKIWNMKYIINHNILIDIIWNCYLFVQSYSIIINYN